MSILTQALTERSLSSSLISVFFICRLDSSRKVMLELNKIVFEISLCKLLHVAVLMYPPFSYLFLSYFCH